MSAAPLFSECANVFGGVRSSPTAPLPGTPKESRLLGRAPMSLCVCRRAESISGVFSDPRQRRTALGDLLGL